MILAGLGLIFLGAAIAVFAFIWQFVEAFKTSTAWGLFSILGLFLIYLPNLIWFLVNWDRGWRIIVTALGAIIPLAVGLSLLTVEGFVQLLFGG